MCLLSIVFIYLTNIYGAYILCQALGKVLGKCSKKNREGAFLFCTFSQSQRIGKSANKQTMPSLEKFFEGAEMRSDGAGRSGAECLGDSETRWFPVEEPSELRR